MLAIRIDSDLRLLHLRGRVFEFSALQVAGKIRKKTCRDLHADAMVFEKNVAGNNGLMAEFLNLAWGQKLAALAWIAVTGTLNVKSGAHQVKHGALGTDVEQSSPEV